MAIRQIVKIGLFIIVVHGCTQREIDNALTSDDFVRWDKNQQITLDMFEGSGDNDTYSAWIGFYFIYDLEDPRQLRFNVTTFLDKKKSFAGRRTNATDSNRYEMFPQLYKLKFDHFEIYARKMRKHLLEHKFELNADTDDEMRLISEKYFDQGDSVWTKIKDEIEREDDYTPEHFRYLRKMIDMDLEALKDFDASKNNYDQNSNR